jgi:hypothetical protein
VSEAICHCGNVKISLAHLPATITSCNCSVCHRLGALWGTYMPDQVKIHGESEHTTPYSWGDQNIAFHHCNHCGCVTHYTLTDQCLEQSPDQKNIVGVNTRMLPAEMTKDIPIKKFDGANTWQFLDS